VRIALLVLAAANLTMVAIMAVAPVHLTDHGHGLEFIGLTISIHVLGMFAPSPLSGWLADRMGGAAVGAMGAALLIAAGLTGMLVDPANGAGFMLVLALLGLGWNGSVVGGSTLLAASAPPALRPRLEAIGEVAMGLAAAVGAPLAGIVVALGGFASLALFGSVAGGMLLVTALWRMRAATGGTVQQLSSKG
jgi:MFS family permease